LQILTFTTAGIVLEMCSDQLHFKWWSSVCGRRCFHWASDFWHSLQSKM